MSPLSPYRFIRETYLADLISLPFLWPSTTLQHKSGGYVKFNFNLLTSKLQNIIIKIIKSTFFTGTSWLDVVFGDSNSHGVLLSTGTKLTST